MSRLNGIHEASSYLQERTVPAPKREKLLGIAESIFSKEGFKGVSVDRLLNEAGVAKMTLYKGFESKNALIEETLRRRGDRLAAHLERSIESADASPENQVLSIFDAMQNWSKRPDFNGCYFVNALSEYKGSEGNISELAHTYKMRLLEFIKSRCRQLSTADPDAMAHSIFLLIEGATVTHMSLGDRRSYSRAKEIAAVLMQT